MALNVKQVVTVGLGLGLTTALGYHFLSSPTSAYTQTNDIDARPLGSFVLAETPEPKRPQVNEPSGFQARQLPSQASASPDMAASYGMLANAQSSPDNLSLELRQTASDAAPFSLELNSPGTVSSLPDSVEVPESSDSAEFEFTPSENFDFAAEIAASPQRPRQQLATGMTAQSHNGRATSNSTNAQMSSNEVASTPASKKSSRGWQGNPYATTGQSITGVAKNQISNEQNFTSNPAPTVGDETNRAFARDGMPITGDRVLSLNDPNRNQHPQEPSSVVTGSIDSLPNPPAANGPLLLEPQKVSLNSAVAQQAAQRIEYGKALSRRGAGFSARQEFLAAMQLIASANDRSTGSNLHSLALKQALQTIEEAADFSVATPEQQIHLDLASVVQTHRCNLLSPAEAQLLSPSQAMNRYFSSAQKQLDFAGGRNVVTAEAYFCLGKLNTLLSRREKVPGPYDTAQSAVFHQAALLSDHRHHRSANELGVLLAKNGRLSQAKLLFERSLKSNPSVRTWQNLAETHRRLGETELANRATNEFNRLAAKQTSNAGSEIQWMPVEQFNAEAPNDNINQQRIATRPAAPAPEQKPSFTDRLKNLF